MKHLSLKSCLALSSLALASACAVPSADIMPRYGQFDLEGHFGVQDGGSGEVSVTDLSKAGFNEDDGFLGGRVDIDFGSPVLMISTQTTNHSGRGTITTDLSASGGTVSAGDMVETDMDFGLHQFALTFDMIPTDLIEVGLGIGLAVVDVDATMMEVSSSGTVQTDQQLPIPQLALRAGVDLGDFEAVGVLSGFELSSSGDKLSFLDLDLLARYRLIGGDDHLSGAIGLGYRVTKLSVDYEDDGDRIDAAFRFNGPYLSLIFSL